MGSMRRAICGASGGFRKLASDEFRILRDPVGLRAECVRDRFQYAQERRPAILRNLGKISAAPKRFAGWRQEHGERPAAAFAERMQGCHIDMIDIGALLAIDLDVYEKLVHDGRGRFVFKAFMRHYMAPMAGGIADREQDRFVLRLCFLERRGAPHPPVHGILGVLQEIGACRLAKLVLAGCGHEANSILGACLLGRKRGSLSLPRTRS
jgi:hypothetical protein